VDAANVILNGRLKIETAFGAKTVCGVASLIDNETQRAGRMLLQEDAERAGHTPGPWDISTSNGHCILAPASTGLCIVATLPTDGSQMPNTKSNARLIAAAPELRAALYKLAREHQELLQTHYGHYPMNCIDYAFEVLAKAGGAL
jgi:hypothetical protein